MKTATCLLILLLVSFVLAKPKPSEDAEAVTESKPDESHKETLSEDDGTSSGDGSGDMADDNGELTPDVLSFNLALFPGSTVFGTSMFQKLQESLRVIRDQLNSMWTMNGNGILDMPDDYKNSTSQSRMINGTRVTINETITKEKDSDGVQSVTHIKVISVHPEGDSDAAPAQLKDQPNLTKVDSKDSESGSKIDEAHPTTSAGTEK